ncbi:hypothetical protein D9613_012821 [Agrocybe pediades]|uniref:Uncharacterized protein n=1 Tax=Agrocybe pediades TaxID=84607 RepID=A0A8H4R3U3_9AGAR|nr:hypothetical protein D9613_012821 [Agrocybe pediades]
MKDTHLPPPRRLLSRINTNQRLNAFGANAHILRLYRDMSRGWRLEVDESVSPPPNFSAAPSLSPPPQAVNPIALARRLHPLAKTTPRSSQSILAFATSTFCDICFSQPPLKTPVSATLGVSAVGQEVYQQQ